MTVCEWEPCGREATHTVDIALVGESNEKWEVCRSHDRVLKLEAVRTRPPAAAPAEEPVIAQCSDCDEVLIDPSAPCPTCQSMNRHMHATDTITVHEAVRVREKHPTKGGWIRETKAGDEYTRDLQAWGRRELTKDREHDLYREVIDLYDGSRIVSTACLSDHHD